jgi:hypothetical protein
MLKQQLLERPLPMALAIGLLLGIALCLTCWPSRQEVAPPASPPALALSSQTETGVAATATGAALARPIFTPARRPPAPAAAVILEATPLELQLTGIITGHGAGVAMALDLRHQKPVTLRSGIRFQDWMVETISRDSVTLRRADEIRLLTLPLAKPAATGP